MQRPRWHDALIIGAIVGLLALGVWALWWDDVRALWKGGPEAAPSGPAPVAAGRT